MSARIDSQSRSPSPHLKHTTHRRSGLACCLASLCAVMTSLCSQEALADGSYIGFGHYPYSHSDVPDLPAWIEHVHGTDMTALLSAPLVDCVVMDAQLLTLLQGGILDGLLSIQSAFPEFDSPDRKRTLEHLLLEEAINGTRHLTSSCGQP